MNQWARGEGRYAAAGVAAPPGREAGGADEVRAADVGVGLALLEVGGACADGVIADQGVTTQLLACA